MSYCPMGYGDLGKCFHLGNLEAIWKVVEILDFSVICQMLGTEDMVVLPHEIVAPLLDEYEEYLGELYGC